MQELCGVVLLRLRAMLVTTKAMQLTLVDGFVLLFVSLHERGLLSESNYGILN